MEPADEIPTFLIWGVDNVVYGPVDLPMLVNWVQEERVTADTWVFQRHQDAWHKAAQVPDLHVFFKGRSPRRTAAASLTVPGETSLALRPGSLRRVKILANMSDEHLEQFVQHMEVSRARQFEEIVKEGSPGDAMFLLLEGEVRVRLIIAGKESILATLSAGEFFGEVALFDHGPRSADVVANYDCLLLRIGASAMQKLVTDAPHLAAAFLFAVSKTLISRIRADNKRYRDSIAFARTMPQ